MRGMSMFRTLFEDKNFYKTLLAIALPITLQNLISSALNMIDTVMIGRLGAAEIGAVGIANQIFFLFSLLLFGVNSGAAIFTAQFWGKKDIANIRRVLGICLITGGIGSLIFTIGGILIPEQLIQIYTKEPIIIELGSQYLRIVACSYIVTAISFAYSFACRSIGQAKLPMYISAISLGCNTVLNGLLIFGVLGFPALGVRGAALATVIARFVEVGLLLRLIYRHEFPLAAKIKEMLDLSKDFVWRFYRTSAPVILNEFLWALGTTIYFIAYARMGEGALAAVQISNTIQNLFMVIFFGLGNGCAIMLGNQIGANQEETAIAYANRFVILGPMLAIGMGLLLVASAPLILMFFNVSPEIKSDTFKILVVIALYLSPRIFNLINIVGILRSGGDTRYALALDFGGVWFVGIPLAFIGAFFWKLPIYGVVALVSVEEVVKFAFGVPRMLSKKWVKNVVNHMEA